MITIPTPPARARPTSAWVRPRTTGLPSPPNPPGTVATAEAYCAGPVTKNGFYGHGIVNAYLAAGGSRN